jgi:voltage-dependent anion channel protein 2
MNIAAAAKFKNYILGGDVEYASSKASPVTKYSLGMGYNAPDFQAAAFYLEKADEKKSKAVQLSYVHHLSATQSVGGEVTKSLSSEETPTFTLGYSRRLENNALAKVKLTSGGIMSLLYETKMMGGEKLSGSFMCDVTDLSKPVKYGFSLDLF